MIIIIIILLLNKNLAMHIKTNITCFVYYIHVAVYKATSWLYVIIFTNSIY